MGKYLDSAGVTTLWNKVKERDESTLQAAQNDASSKYATITDFNSLLSRVNTFLASADLTESAIDTLKEIQDYIKNHGTEASNMLQAIDSLEGDVTALEGYFTNGIANTAAKLSSSAGSATQPVYFSGGKPVACTYTLGKSVPSNAVFTDTTYSVFGGATSSAAGSSGLVPAPTQGSITKYLKGNGSWSDITSDEIIASSSFATSHPEFNGTTLDYILNNLITDINTRALASHTHSVATTSANGFMSSSMVTKLNGITAGATADSAITSDELATILV